MQILPGLLNLVAMGPPQIEFDFELSEALWKKSFEELRLFAKANGGVAHVSQTHPARSELGRWCATQARRPSLARSLIEQGRCWAWTVTDWKDQ